MKSPVKPNQFQSNKCNRPRRGSGIEIHSSEPIKERETENNTNKEKKKRNQAQGRKSQEIKGPRGWAAQSGTEFGNSKNEIEMKCMLQNNWE